MDLDRGRQNWLADGLLTAAGQLGLAKAKYRKEVANNWQFQPLAGPVAYMATWEKASAVGTWQGRRASATLSLPISGTTTMVSGHHGQSWSEGQVLITSVGFVAGVLPFMAAAPTTPFRIDEHKTYTWQNWVPGLGVTEFGTQIPVPGDTNNTWMVRALQTERPATVLAAIAPMLLSEPAYPWRIDGGKKGSHEVDLVRVDLAMPDAPQVSAEFLADRLGKLTQLAATIEQALTAH
jgi:hypothetical protein